MFPVRPEWYQCLSNAVSLSFFCHSRSCPLTTSGVVRTVIYIMHRALSRATFGLYLVAYVLAHPHHNELTEEEANNPVDSILWIHIFLQAMVWGVMFPLGMVLGITRSRWHVPLQVSSSCTGWVVAWHQNFIYFPQATGYVLTVGGYILGHSHKGRGFLPSAHEKFANVLSIPIISQLVLGIYLKLHIHEKSVRPYFVVAHGIIGKIYPILAWTQMLFGIIAFRGYCRGGALGKSAADANLKIRLYPLKFRSMPCTLHHGKRFCCIRNHHDDHFAGGRTMDAQKWKKSRVIRFKCHYYLGTSSRIPST